MKFKDPSPNEPKILVISNNAFSETSNNGKTLASFFNGFPPGNIAQLYFNSEMPNGTSVDNFYRITDKDIIKSIVKKDNQCGSIINKLSNNATSNSEEGSSSFIKVMRKYNAARIIREILWVLGRWKSYSLQGWLDEFSPDIIFFCAGDSGFAYNISNYIQKRCNSRVVIYVTDDYVLPRKTLNPIWWLRRNYIYRKMRSAVTSSDLFITISQKMRDEYKDFFCRDSILAVNMTESMRDEAESIKEVLNDNMTFVYAGGLHYKRYETLSLLAESIRKYNRDSNNPMKVNLRIYSNQKPNSSIIKKLDIDGASEFCGSLNLKELKKVLNTCDVPVHVESFDKRSIEATKLSISTKIPEYLSLNKPVLAIGPDEVASIDYLKDTAFCITDQERIYDNLRNFIDDKELQSILSKSALEKFEENHKKEILIEKFKASIFSIMRK